MDATAAVGILLLVLPGAAALGLYVASRRRLAAELPTPAFRGVRAAWLAGGAGLLATPFFVVYATWTTAGRLDAPAPGLAGLRVAGWLLLGSLGLVVVGVGLAAGAAAWRRFGE